MDHSLFIPQSHLHKLLLKQKSSEVSYVSPNPWGAPPLRVRGWRRLTFQTEKRKGQLAFQNIPFTVIY